jgi:hypothetical protein
LNPEVFKIVGQMTISNRNDPVEYPKWNATTEQSSVDRTGKECLTVQSAKEEVKSERQLQEQICALLRNRGIVFQRSRMDRKTTGTVGWPDISFAFNGIPHAWEIKTATGKLSEEQSRCIEAMRKNGWNVQIIRSLDVALNKLRLMGAEELK